MSYNVEAGCKFTSEGRTLLHILAPRPDPEGPQWMIRFPICESTGCDNWKASSVPPTRNESVAALAPVTPEKLYGDGELLMIHG